MSTSNQSIVGDSHTLWMGDIDSWMDEKFIYNIFQNLGRKLLNFILITQGGLVNVKIIRDKGTGFPAGNSLKNTKDDSSFTKGYGFIEF